MGLNNKTNKIGLSQILMSLILHRINVTSLIRTNSVIGTEFLNRNTYVRISEGVLYCINSG